MGYIIGSFNLQKLADPSKKDMDTIARIIKGEEMIIVALQEVFKEDAVKTLIRSLGESEWDYAWKNSDGDFPNLNSNEGYAYVWNKRFMRRVESSDEERKKGVYRPVIYKKYKKWGGSELRRPPFYGRFTPSGVLGGNQMELRLLNIHLAFSGNKDDYSKIETRRHEFRILTESILPNIQDTVYGTQYNSYTLILGDYNLNIPNHTNSSPYLNDFVTLVTDNNKVMRIVTVQDEKTTLKNDQEADYQNPNDRYANNYDHFTYDESMLGKCEILQCRRVNGEKYTDGNYHKYLKNISDHMPILIEIDIKG